MQEAPTAPQDADTRSRLATVVWLVSSMLLVALVVGVWVRVGGDRAGANISNAIISGERPEAPALPTEGIDRDGAPGLPAWYRASGDVQRVNAPGAEVLVVNWWASWCGPCIEEADVLREAAADYDGRVSIIGMNPESEDLESDARAFVRRHDLQALSIVRASAADQDAWGVRGSGFPATFVVGTDGRISSFVNGQVDEETLRGLIDAELDEQRA